MPPLDPALPALDSAIVVLLLISLILFIVVLAMHDAGISPCAPSASSGTSLCSLPGTHVRVTSDGNKVLVRIL